MYICLQHIYTFMQMVTWHEDAYMFTKTLSHFCVFVLNIWCYANKHMERNETLVTNKVKTRIVMLHKDILELEVQLIRCIPPRPQSINYLFPTCPKSAFLYSSPQGDRLQQWNLLFLLPVAVASSKCKLGFCGGRCSLQANMCSMSK